MRINPINYQTTLTKTSNKEVMHNYSNVKTHPQAYKSMDLNLLNKNYNNVGINFRGTQNTTLEVLKKIPLEERLASLFQNFKTGDLILIGENLKEAKKSMYQATGVIKNVIKRAFFLEDNNIKGYLGFAKTLSGENEVINLNKDNIKLISENKVYELKPDESFYVIEGDNIEINGFLLPIKNEPHRDLSFFRKSFAKAFDFENQVKPDIDKINKKSISSLTADEKKRVSKVTFADVGGQDKLINEMKKSIIYPLRYPDGYANMDVNHGFILYGPPGTGKTHIARALANEADANFISLNGLDLESKWVGESEANWRNLFAEAKANQPTIIFIDEFDAVARSRDSYDEYGNKVVNQILTLMTDIDNDADNIFVIGATNNFKALDSAITRSGRFGKHLEVALPDKEGISKIFDIHAKNKPLDDSISKENLINQFFELKASGADIKYVINEAHNNGYERAGIFKKMEDKTLTNLDLEEFKIQQEDFDKVLADFTRSKNVPQRKPIGFKSLK